MIDDSERREIAAKLRGLEEYIDGAPLIFTEYLLTKYCPHCGAKVVE